jgi:hypothetical protein
MRVFSIGVGLAICVATSACGTASQPDFIPTAPTPAATSHIVTIDIAEVNGHTRSIQALQLSKTTKQLSGVMGIL